MIYKNASKLRKAYFLSYLKLIMNTQSVKLAEAKEITFERLFDSNSEKYGAESYENFLNACSELDESEDAI